MTLQEYLGHYFSMKEMLLFLGLAIMSLLISIGIIVVADYTVTKRLKPSKRAKAFYCRTCGHIERFYEMMFSGTSILSFLSAYYLIERFVTTGDFRVFWDDHKDLLLLVMIVVSCLFNTILDKFIVPLKLDKEERGSVRMIGMLYIILIFVYIKFIYENNNYDGFIIYFLGLMVGRFIYFDASFHDFVESTRRAARNFLLMLLGLSLTGLMCFVGFKNKYLLISNGVLVSCFISHIFIVIAIFLVNVTGIVKLFVRKPSGKKCAEDIDNVETVEEQDEIQDYTIEIDESFFE